MKIETPSATLLPNEYTAETQDFLGSSTGSDPGIRWRPWPCAACNEGLAEIGFLRRCGQTSESASGLEFEEIVRAQKALLLGWVGQCPHTSWRELSHPRIAEGSEHLVFFDTQDAQVYKVTRPGIFGESYYLQNGLVFQRECTPLDYLLRLQLWSDVFTMASRSLGISETGQLVSVQPFISGGKPAQAAVDQFLADSGLLAVKKSCWLWKKVIADYEVWIGDARDDNFVETETDIIPIDLRLWFQ